MKKRSLATALGFALMVSCSDNGIVNTIESVEKEQSSEKVTRLTSAKTDDLIFINTTGQLHFWEMEGGNRITGQHFASPIDRAAWEVKGSGDVDGDGQDDIIFQRNDGQVHYWKMNGSTRIAGYNIHTPVSSDWKLVGVGDVDGDGTDDIIWHHIHGQAHYWPMQNGIRQGGIDVGNRITDWKIAGSGDVNGDGTDDLVWQHVSNGNVCCWQMQNGQVATHYLIGSPVFGWDLIDIGDMNGDQTDDLVWFNTSNRDIAYWEMDNGVSIAGHLISSSLPPEWTLVAAGELETAIDTFSAVGFTGAFKPSMWTLSGVVPYNMSDAALSFNCGYGGGGVTATISVPVDGTISFDWEMVVTSGGQYGDFIKYIVNGVGTDLSLWGSASGSVVDVHVNAGDVFQFYTWGTTKSSSYHGAFNNFEFVAD